MAGRGTTDCRRHLWHFRGTFVGFGRRSSRSAGLVCSSTRAVSLSLSARRAVSIAAAMALRLDKNGPNGLMASCHFAPLWTAFFERRASNSVIAMVVS